MKLYTLHFLWNSFLKYKSYRQFKNVFTFFLLEIYCLILTGKTVEEINEL